ncbi:MAG: two-component regulator propeller domain-containing protein [Bacteroidota bacterium]|nr:two-component regulator propeller domain-containing protein [Bacteroidota bacterium]
MMFGTPIQAHIQCFFSNSKGRNWVGTGFGLKVLRDNNVYLFSAKNGSFNFRVTSIIEDQIGNLWIGTHGNGLYKLDTAGYIKKFYVKDEISLDRVMSLFEDTEGGIWIGTRGGGLHRLQKKIFKTYTRSDGLSDNRVWSICESRNNDIWIGTQKGLNKLSFSKSSDVITSLPIPGDEQDNTIRTVIEDDSGVLWISTKNNIFRYVNQKIEQYMSFGWARAMAVDSDNRIWIGGVGAGLARAQKESYQKYFTEGRNLRRDVYQIKALCYDAKGSLWIGTKNGLFRFSGDSLYYVDKEPGLTGNAVMTLFNDSKGTLWITVYGFGLFRFNTGNSEKQFSRITKDNGLIDNTIYSILEDDYGKFWFGSKKGIFSINRQEVVDFCDGKIFSVHAVAYGLEAGMESIECNGGNHPSAIKSKDGQLWFPTMGGVTVVDPVNLNRKQDPLKVYIQKTVVDGVELSTNRLHSLEPGNKRKIEFRFTAINFSNPENVRFKYRLEGYDDEWVNAQNHRTIFYLNIPPGRYTFRVLASNHTGAWNSEGDSISFEIPPHYWETTTFKILVGIFIVGIIIGITRMIFSRKLKHQLYILENQRALEQERLRISRDIHDEIGSRLTKISVLNEAVKDEIDKAPLIQEFTEKISNETKQIIENLDEIIWFINPGNDSIELLGTFLREYIADFFSSTDIECVCDFPDLYPERKISPEVRRNTVLTVKEITNNIVKHASATKVNAKFHLQEQSILISLEDNGKGFCTRGSHPLGNGLINIKKRIEEIGGKIIIESVVSSGTAIQIFIPLKNM